MTLWLYIVKDMWRQILLTATVLVTVLAFALVVKPLAEGLLSPWQCVQLLGLSILPALQYALPFAACFGATLSYYRLASDNELVAAHAGGISHRALLMPAAISGAVLLVVLLVLSNSVIPRFLRQSERIVAVNAATYIESTIKRGRAIKTDIQGSPAYIYADRVRRFEPGNDTGATSGSPNAFEILLMDGIVFATLGPGGQVAAEGSAQQAHVWINKRPTIDDSGRSTTEVWFMPQGYVGAKDLSRAEGGQAVQRFYIPNSMKDDPKFMSFAELLELSDEPDRLGSIDERRRKLALALSEIEIAGRTRDALRQSAQAEFFDAEGTTRYVLRAADLRRVPKDPRWWRIRPGPATDQIVLEEHVPGAKPLVQVANAGWLRVGITDTIGEPERIAVHIRLRDVAAALVAQADRSDTSPYEGPEEAIAPEVAGAKPDWNVQDLRPSGALAAQILDRSSRELDQMSENLLAASPRDSESLVAPLKELRRATASLLREIMSKHHERFAMAGACLVMVVLGAIMAMKLRESVPLKIYLWAFFPALAAVLTISTGQQLTHQHGPVGLLALWGGVAALSAYAVHEFRLLARH